MKLYIAKDGDSLGPYHEAQVRVYLVEGIFTPADLGCLEGQENWQPLRDLLPPPPKPLVQISVPPPDHYMPIPYHEPRPARQIQPARTVAHQPPGERVFYDHAGISVTNARFIVAGQTYAMRNITSVHTVKRPPENGFGYLLSFVGVGTMIYGLANNASGATLTGIALLALGLLILFSVKAKYFVVLTTNAGQVQAVTHTDLRIIGAITHSINEAMVAHV